jgi:hypothetical protein
MDTYASIGYERGRECGQMVPEVIAVVSTIIDPTSTS